MLIRGIWTDDEKLRDFIEAVYARGGQMRIYRTLWLNWQWLKGDPISEHFIYLQALLDLSLEAHNSSSLDFY